MLDKLKNRLLELCRRPPIVAGVYPLVSPDGYAIGRGKLLVVVMRRRARRRLFCAVGVERLGDELEYVRGACYLRPGRPSLVVYLDGQANDGTMPTLRLALPLAPRRPAGRRRLFCP